MLVIQNLKTNKTGYAQVMPIGDTHIGASNFLPKLLKQKIDYCLENNIYVIGMGDILEMASKSSPGTGVYTQSKVDEQIEKYEEIFEPLQKAGLLLGLLKGNHEGRTEKSTGVDITKMVAKVLRTKYLGLGVHMLLRAGKQSYKFYATHGKRSSSIPEGKIKVAKSLFAYIDADIILHAHTHGLGHERLKYYEISKKRKVVESKYKHAILTGSFLGYRGSYAEESTMLPAIVGCPLISLNPETQEVKVELST